MKKSLVTIMVCILCCFMFTGCSGEAQPAPSEDKTDNTAVQEEQPQAEPQETDKDIEVENDNAPAESEEENDVLKEKNPGEVPKLIMHRYNTAEYDGGDLPRVEHSYSFVTLDPDQTAVYQGLADSLVAAMNEIITKEQEVWSTDIDTIKENDGFTIDESWNTFVRRADADVTSIVNEFCVEGEYDGGFFSDYIAHSYHTDTGKEISFSEIIKDEDKFFDILVSKMIKDIDHEKKNVYALDVDTNEQQLKSDIRGYIESGECAWTVDPHGVTVWVNAYTILPGALSATVCFSDDKNGEIFAKEFSDGAKDEWITQLPYYTGSYYDIDDSGREVYVSASQNIDMKEVEAGEIYYISGFRASCDGQVESFNTSNPGGTNYYDIFLLHKDHKTILLENHDEYDKYLISTYTLNGDGINMADYVSAGLAFSEDLTYRYQDTYLPYYLPTDMSGIAISVNSDTETGQTDVMSVDMDGKLSSEKTDLHGDINGE